MNKPFFIIIFVIAIFFMSASSLFPAQIATTEDGKRVILDDNRTWRYLEFHAQRDEVLEVNNRLRYALGPYIRNRDPNLLVSFSMNINIDDTYEKQYADVMEGLYLASGKLPSEEFYNRLIVAFGEANANDIMWVIDHWTLWKTYCLIK